MQTRQRKGAAQLHKQRQRRALRQPAQQGRHRIYSHLDDALGACADLVADHGEDCECETCCLVSNLVGAVRVFHMLLEIT